MHFMSGLSELSFVKSVNLYKEGTLWWQSLLSRKSSPGFKVATSLLEGNDPLGLIGLGVSKE